MSEVIKDGDFFKVVFKRRLYNLSVFIVCLVDGLSGGGVSGVLGNQLVSSGTSIVVHFIEGRSGQSRKGLIKYLFISLRLVNERTVWVCLLRDTERIRVIDGGILLGELRGVCKFLGRSIMSLKGGLRVKS